MASVALAVLLLVGFKAPQDGVVMGAARTSGGGGTTGGSNATSRGTTGGTTGGATGAGTSGSASTTGGGKTYDGSVVSTRYGLVQVEITVSGGKVTSVTALELPVGGRSGMISGYAGPILSSEAVSAQSASIDLVSGATYTSDAYAQSLQAALDQAGI
jgi:uncharacterized protein with FMN-binding domain